MSGERLRAELERIAEGAPRVDIPDDLYARGRRATARARILAASAAGACIALLVAVLAPALKSDDTPVAADVSVGVPRHVHAVPTHVEDREPDLKIGIGAAAFVTETGIPVVVDAATGEYHLLDLDGLLSDSRTLQVGLDHPPVALSPDGTHLAWGWVDQGPMAPETPETSERTADVGGIRIADLETGEVRDVSVDRDSSTLQFGRFLAHQVSWSPDSRWLAWGGTWVTAWTEETFSSDGYTAGRVAPGETRSSWNKLPEPTVDTDREVAAGDVPFLVAVANGGDLTALSGNLLWSPANQARVSLRSDQRVGSIWFEGDRVSALVHSVDEDVALVRQLPDGEDQVVDMLGPDPRVLGVLRDGTLLVHPESLDGDGFATTVDTVALDPSTDGVDVRRVIDVDAGVLDLTVATDLMDPDDPTVDRPDPDWPWSTERKLVVGGLTLLGLVLLGGVALSARRLSSR